jgi:hypothetical protein
MTLQQLLIVAVMLLEKLIRLIFPQKMLLIIQLMVGGVMLLFPDLLRTARFSGGLT